MSCFVFRSCSQGLSFQGGEKPRGAAGACEEPLLLSGSWAHQAGLCHPLMGALGLRALMKP